MDRYGRKRILILNISVVILNDFLTWMVFFFPNNVPGGYWILIITPIVEGILGSKSVRFAVTLYVTIVSTQLLRPSVQRKQHTCVMFRNLTSCM